MRILFTFLSVFFLFCNSCFAGSIDEKIDTIVAPWSDFISNRIVFYPIHINGVDLPIIIIWLFVAGIVFTVSTKGISIWGFKHALDLLTGKVRTGTRKGEEGEVSSFQALMTALSGTVGLGNIAGVAVAITMGGPGALFWMIIAAFLGMTSKFVEATMGVKYRKINIDGSVSGGPMYYIMYGLTKMKLRFLALPMAVFFSVMCIAEAFGGGNMFQINMATKQVIEITGGASSFFYSHEWVFGTIVAVVVGCIVIGGIKSIVKVTEKLVPFMIALYMIASIIIIFANFMAIPHCIKTVITQAFHPVAVKGGILGAIIWGMRRSVQSNEAGVGSAPIAYSAVQTTEPVSQGFISLLEPFIDTVIVCSMTGFVIISTGQYLNAEGIEGVELASRSFATVIPFFPIILAFVVIMFALSTLISWAYYGQKAWSFLFGENDIAVKIFQVIFCIFIVIGSALNVQSVVDFTDAMMFAMSVPNIIVLYIMLPIILKDLKKYCRKYDVGIHRNKNTN